MTVDLTCREFVEFLADFLAGELPADRHQVFLAHLAVCPPCVAYMKTYQQAIALGKAAFAPAEALPSDVPEELIQAILAARET